MPKQLNVNLAFTADTAQAKRQIQDLFDSLNKVATKPTQLFDDINLKNASKAANELQMHLQKAVDVDTGKLDLSKFAISLNASNKQLKDYQKDLAAIGPEGQVAFLKLSQSIAQADAPLLQANKRLNEFKTTLMNTLRWQISSSVLHSVIGAVQTAYYYAQDLDKSLTNIRIVTGQSADEMARFAIEANKAAKQLSTTTTEYTDASLIYYQQGLNNQQVKERTDVTVKLANVTGMSAQAVSEQMTAIWNNFDDGTQSLEHYADVLTALGASTASSSAEIAGGMQQFAASAKTVGLSYEYAASALATVVAATRQSENVVGNAFKTLFSRLEGLKLGETLEDGTTLNKYSAALEAVGVSIKDQHGELKNMDTILDEMAAKWKLLTKDQQMALAQTVGGVRQYTQLIALMDKWGDFETNLNTAMNAEGALQEQADIFEQGWEAAKNHVKASLEDLYSTLIDRTFFTDLYNSFAKLINYINSFIKGFGGIKSVLLTVSSLFMQHFAKEMPAALSRLQQQFQYFSGQGRKNAIELKKQNAEALQEMSTRVDIDRNPAMAAEIQGYIEINNLKQQLIEKEGSLTQAEKSSLEQTIAQKQAAYEQLVMLGKQIELQRQQTKELTEQAIQSSLQTKNNRIAAARKKGDKNVHFITANPQENEIRETLAGYETYLNIINQISNAQRTAKEQGDQWAQADKLNTQEVVNKMKDYIASWQDLGIVSTDTSTASGAAFVALAEKIKAAGDVTNLTEEEIKQLVQEFLNFANMPSAFQSAGDDINALRTQAQRLLNDLKGQDVSQTIIAKLEQLLKDSTLSAEEFKQRLAAIQSEAQGTVSHVATFMEGMTKAAAVGTQLMGTYNAATQAVKVFGDKSSTTGDKVSAVMGTMTSGIFAASQAFRFLTETMKLSGLAAGIWGIAITAVITLIGVLITKAEEQKQKAIEAANATAESARKTNDEQQQLVETNSQLIEGLSDLYREYKRNNNASDDFKSHIEKLIDVYDIQDGRLLLLQGKYDELIAKINEAHQAELDRAADTASEVVGTNKAAVNTKIKNTITIGGSGLQTQNDELKAQVIKIIEKSGLQDIFTVQDILDANGENTNGWWGFNFKNIDVDNIQQVYEVLKQIYALNNGLIDDNIFTQMQEIFDSEEFKAIEPAEKAMQLADLRAGLSSASNISSMQEMLGVMQKLNTAGLTHTEILNETSKYLGSLATDYDLLSSVASQTGIAEEELAKWYDGLDEAQKSVLFQIRFDKVKSIDDLNNELFNLQESANKNAIKVELQTVRNAQDTYKSGMNPEELLDWKQSSGIQWTDDSWKEFSALSEEGREDWLAKAVIDKEDAFVTAITNETQALQARNEQIEKENAETQDKIADSAISEYLNVQQQIDDLLTSVGNDSGTLDFLYAAQDRLLQQYPGLKEQVAEYYDQLQANTIELESNSQAIDYNNELLRASYDAKAKTAATFDELHEMFKQGAIDAQAFNGRLKQLYDELDKDVNKEEWEDLSKFLQKNAKEIKGVSDQLTTNKKVAERVAESILRFDDAIVDVTDHYDDWMNALQNGTTQDQAKAAKEMSDAYADMLGLDFETFSGKFLQNAENLELMKQAAEGVDGAYEQLQAKAAEDILWQCGLDTSQFQADLDWINSVVVNGANFPDLEVGASLNDADFLAELTNLVNAAGFSADQATSYLASMGIDATVKTTDEPRTDTTVIDDFRAKITPTTYTATLPGSETMNIDIPNITYERIPRTYNSTSSNSAFALEVTSANKSSGGNFKRENSSHGGGGASSGGGGGGGSTPKHQNVNHVNTQKTANLKTGDQSGERYHVINNQIEDLANQYDRLSEAEERAFGKSKLALMDQQVDLLNQQYKAQRKLREEAEKYWKEDMENLVNGQLDTTGDGKIDTLGAKAYLGKDVQFDKNGTILNYDELINAADERYNKLTNSYNDFIGKYNEAIAARNTAIDKYNGMSAEEQETIKDQWQAESEQWDAEAEKWEAQKETWDARHEEEENYYNNFMGLIDQYEDTQDKVQQELNKEIEAYHATLDKLLEKTEYHVQLKIDISNDALKLIDFLQKTVYSSEWQAAKNIESAGQKFDLSLNNIATQREGLAEMFQHHFDVDHVFDNSNADVGSNEFLKAMHDLGYKSGEEIVNGLQAGDQKLKDALGSMENEFTEKEVADWRKGLDEILKETENLWQQREDVFSYMDKYIDASNQKLDDMASHMDHLANVTSKYKDIMDLVGHNKGGFDTEAIKAVTAAQQALRQDAVKSAKARNDLAQSELEAAKASKQAAIENGVTSERDLELWDKEIQKLQERADSTKEELLEDLHAVLQGAADQFKETIQLMAEDMSKAMAGAAGSLEGLSQQMSQYEKTHSTMVPEYERVYQLNKLNAAAIKAIDETNNIRAKEQLLEYQKQILEAQESGREMSQWELSNLEKELALRQAALAVEEATSVKSQVRMSRDNEGNYSYIYTADESAVGDAEANYRDKLYEMQKANSDYINQLQNDIVSLESEYLSAIQEAADMYGIGSDEYYTALNRINEWYNQAVTEKNDELNRVMAANQELQEFDTNFHARMTGDKQVSDEGYVKTFEQTVLSQLTGYKNAEDAMGAWKDTVDTFSTEANDDINSVRNLVGEYESTNKEAMSNAGIEIDDNKGTWEGFAKYLTGEDGKTGALGDIITESNELAEKIKALGEEYGNQINNVIMPSVVDWETKYSNMIEKQVADNTKLGESINEVILKLSGLDKLIKDIKAKSPINIEVNVPEVDPIHVEVIYDDPGFTPEQPEPLHVGTTGGGGGGDSNNSNGGSYNNTDTGNEKTLDPKWYYDDTDHWKQYTDGTEVDKTREKHIHGAPLSNDADWMCPTCYYSHKSKKTGSVADILNNSSSMAKSYTNQAQGSSKKKNLQHLITGATGMYTGDWGSSEGRIAILHEKELVLNKEDTQNMLTAVNLVRQISQTIDLNAASASSAFSAMFAGQVSMGNQALEQDVHITAEFPNATDRNEILAAFDNVINLASQYANRKVPTANKQTTKF